MNKQSFLTLCLLIISVIFYSQKTKHEKRPKGMKFCPMGSFEMKKAIDKDTSNVSVSVRSFWVSNEISNKEFREFYYYLKNNPHSFLEHVDLTKQKEGTSKPYIVKIPHSELLANHINTEVFNDDSEKKNYFFDSKFNDYPVVAITRKAAEAYCIWRTTVSNNALSEKAKPHVMAYRLPTEAEWEYLTTFGYIKKLQRFPIGIHPVKKGLLNSLGIYNLKGNVTEWTLSNRIAEGKKQALVLGSSWKEEINKQAVAPDTKSDHIGFRIVRDYIGD